MSSAARGGDKNGYFETVRGEKVERREVKWSTVYVNYNPNDIPSEWRMWLRKLRENPPTDAEMAQSQAKAEIMKQKVAAIDEEERLRRLRMESMGMHAHQASPQPDLSRFLQNVDSESAAGPSGAASKPQQSAGDFKPEAWSPKA
ncbi:hypothetical protein CEUSTIGMA_g1201.t1 [Chlamydomonas eustigma]|uniref:Uncharacterized protein n=1 Tax=Chlamydomonas eustigma TaxID=1157962 RepID=A0A250WSS3_9CHLO|nr:hypothetical protein CEUSTIGMA_g1201.t1 [Chlamydomonas eustigma]|eukprot:GAX73749.1 hypothetical protein CEUSTIGMA_g1201.t1 [Chlamydomonas eustigma]